MDGREIDMYRIEDVVRALLDKTPVKQIARQQRISKNSVKKYRRVLEEILVQKPWIANNFDEIMKEFRSLRTKERYSENHGWLLENTELVNELSGKCDNYVRLYQVLQEKGFAGSYSSLQRYVAKSNTFKDRPVFRIETKPGEIAQVDFGHIGRIHDEKTGEAVKAYVFVMVLGFSRDAYYEIVKSQDIETWCSCHVHAFEHFGGVPRVVIPDNLKSAIIKAAYLDPLPNRSYADLAKHYSFQIDPCLPGTPEHKGKVESGVKYVKNNFVPLRDFKNFSDANMQLQEWNITSARNRIHGTTRQKPSYLFYEHEASELKPLTTERFEIPIWKRLKVYRDIHIQFDKAYYSVPHELRSEYVDVRKTASQLTVFFDNKLVAVHLPVSSGKRNTNRDHYPAEIGRYMEWDTDYCIQEALKIGRSTYQIVSAMLDEEAIRNLRSAQNIIRLKTKYGKERLEAACTRAVFFGSYKYGSVKNILERELDNHEDFFESTEKQLSTAYARGIDELLNKEAFDGNICTN